MEASLQQNTKVITFVQVRRGFSENLRLSAAAGDGKASRVFHPNIRIFQW